ncbi:hypothetical protein BDP27DRAFT_1372717 [Rhodocollybia butyracea]|uniref:Uncharacterized protein n=1 Tax=Rhodocollybia butyracea TaxID=206335 RepID=A0A9P5P7X4_9AGAR|nr:hypothetical protein BDP27DRAFT_1372717 [Rhodocollybia butyracea]
MDVDPMRTSPIPQPLNVLVCQSAYNDAQRHKSYVGIVGSDEDSIQPEPGKSGAVHGIATVRMGRGKIWKRGMDSTRALMVGPAVTCLRQNLKGDIRKGTSENHSFKQIVLRERSYNAIAIGRFTVIVAELSRRSPGNHLYIEKKQMWMWITRQAKVPPREQPDSNGEKHAQPSKKACPERK